MKEISKQTKANTFINKAVLFIIQHLTAFQINPPNDQRDAQGMATFAWLFLVAVHALVCR
jgi:hypothetical protein